jgi:uncharacterized protein
MSATLTKPPSSRRILAVDAVRGFALAGVALVHMLEQYVGAPMPEGKEALLMPETIDKVVMGLDFTFLVGKFYVLFSLLFGLSFFIQMDRAAQRGEDFRARFAWRLAILFGFGFLHHFFYRADILTTYAVLGLLLIPSYRLGSRWLLALASLLFLGVGRFASFAAFGAGPIAEVGMLPSAEWVSSYWNALTTGTLLDVFSLNALGAYPPLINFQYGIFGRGYITLGLFLLGLWLGRTRFFETVETRRRFVMRALWTSVGASVVSLALTGALFSQLPQPPTMDTWGAAVALTAYDLFNLALAAAWLFAFLAVCQRRWGNGLLRAFAPYGRMGLTNYVLQGVVGSFVYYNWGLGRLGEWPASQAAVAGIAFITIGLVASRVWLKHFYYGPLEWLWRSLTHFRSFDLRRRDQPSQSGLLAA